jgi:predicted dehydrogenase
MTYEANVGSEPLDEVRAILIGCGDHGGDTLLPACLSAGIRVVAVVDQNQGRARMLAQRWSIPAISESVERLGAIASPSVAIVALPPREQGRHVAWALSRDLHVLVEKPPAVDPNELGALVDRAKATDKACCVAMNFRFSDGVRALTERLRSGRHGPVRFVRLTHLARKPVAPLDSQCSFEASLFHAQGIHALDLALQLVPSANVVQGQFIRVQRGRFCTMTGRDALSGSGFEVSFGSCGAGFHHQIDVLCEKGDLLSLHDLSELSWHPNGGEANLDEYPGARVLWRRSPVAAGYSPAGYSGELKAFRLRVSQQAKTADWSAADLEQLVPVYHAFDTLLEGAAIGWRT